VPGIHEFHVETPKDVDGRDKPGHDKVCVRQKRHHLARHSDWAALQNRKLQGLAPFVIIERQSEPVTAQPEEVVR
jgi:hypothetical protein